MFSWILTIYLRLVRLIRNNSDVAKDRISELPDSILQEEILTRLPTKLAVTTSILCKRWRWLWIGAPALDFSCTTNTGSRSRTMSEFVKKAKTFMDYVDNVLLHHYISTLNLRSFYLACDDHCDESRIFSWISNVAHHNLHELHLHIGTEQPFAIPQSVYSCEFLTVLELSLFGGVFNLPKSTSLPFLRTLVLGKVTFVDEDLTQQFFSSFLALNYLLLNHCTFYNHKKLVISATSLHHLIIEKAQFSEAAGPIDVHGGPTIKICAPKLDSLFCFTNKFPREFILQDMPVLQVAWIDGEENQALIQEQVFQNVRSLLTALVNVKKLYIAANMLEALLDEDLVSHIPIFTNLTHLQVIGFGNNGDSLRVLRVMPNLENLTFDQVIASSKDEWVSRIVESFPRDPRLMVIIQNNEKDESIEDSCIMRLLIDKSEALEITEITKSTDIYPNFIVRLQIRSLIPGRPSFLVKCLW
ncbi:hypothetical protein Scep_013020 [Stephania cephalantha]|uniref:F-box/LRR-repeat protein 15/At3g58940/PEG3-like LRR domain-containing protein n=1 Tax=Stephania cephalantha TaxID=152367 RepID=A0AAP0P706_9MAGN